VADGPAAPLVLASASPRRRELLALLRRPFVVDAADVDESVWPDETPLDYVVRVAEAKAAVVAERHAGRLVIAADTTVDLDGEILAKPTGDEDAARMLHALSGRAHRVHTHVVVAMHGPRADRGTAATVTTVVEFAPLDEDEIAAYVATGEPLDKAGAYAIQRGAAPFVRRIDGSVTNVVGLPLAELRELLAEADTWLALPSGTARDEGP
jgi:septum formation protein